MASSSMVFDNVNSLTIESTNNGIVSSQFFLTNIGNFLMAVNDTSYSYCSWYAYNVSRVAINGLSFLIVWCQINTFFKKKIKKGLNEEEERGGGWIVLKKKTFCVSLKIKKK
ncbi:hypothetical protein RFI_12241 [Reticulomyxa filosa]|uniref:Uncharacterized protein n=1 Tax=Reticulomyxa filosa TaxID=46433 RepID=X6NG37_RETFI|nr:hypothetical protein RFI_12241 [Reticulomyxa filosa]|eukprot:ETO24916.1 hypothetical protein RFI_12241 [Reticulomyxa filosa]